MVKPGLFWIHTNAPTPEARLHAVGVWEPGLQLETQTSTRKERKQASKIPTCISLAQASSRMGYLNISSAPFFDCRPPGARGGGALASREWHQDRPNSFVTDEPTTCRVMHAAACTCLKAQTPRIL